MLGKCDSATDDSERVELKQLSGVTIGNVPPEKETLAVPQTQLLLVNVATFSQTASTRAGLFRVILACLAAGIGWMCIGFGLAYSSPAIPDINAHPSPYQVTRQDQSFVVSVSFISTVAGAPFAAALVDKFGRKIAIMLATIPAALSWILVVTSQNVIMLVAARFIHGISGAIFATSVSLYVAETSPPSIRGLLMSNNAVLRSLGILLAYVAGSYVRYNWLAVVGLCPVLLVVVLMALVPETPRWLLMRGKLQEATDSLTWLRAGATSESVQQKVMEIQVGLKAGANRKPVPWRVLLRPPLLKIVAVSQGLALIYSLTGMHIVIMYTVTIFQLTGSGLDPHMQTIVVGVVMLFGSVTCVFVIDRLPRRGLLIACLAAMTVGWLSMGTFFLVLDRNAAFALEQLYWLPMLSMVTIVYGSNVGVATLPVIVTNEMFPTRARGRALSLFIVTMGASSALSTNYFLRLEGVIGNFGAFWLCGLICSVAFIFVYFYVPETKGQSLEKLQQQLKILSVET